MGHNPLFGAQIISDLAIGNALKLAPVFVESCFSVFVFYYKNNICLGRGDMGPLCTIFSTSYKSIIIF